MKIGLISDTHLSAGQLPLSVFDAFQNVDRILHAGDLVTLHVVRRLESIAPVSVVQGNMDMPGVRLNAPAKTVVKAEGRRIGLIHGHHVPHPNRVLSPPIDLDAMHEYLLSEFQPEEVDCIVYGHTHQAHVGTFKGILIINPGSATRGRSGPGTVGLLTVGRDQMRGEIIRLQ